MKNRRGLHARASARFVTLASGLSASVETKLGTTQGERRRLTPCFRRPDPSHDDPVQ